MMKNLKEKMKHKSFWLTLVGAVIMFLQLLGVKVDAPYINEIINAFCAIAIILGIMSDTPPPKENEQIKETEDEEKDKTL